MGSGVRVRGQGVSWGLNKVLIIDRGFVVDAISCFLFSRASCPLPIWWEVRLPNWEVWLPKWRGSLGPWCILLRQEDFGGQVLLRQTQRPSPETLRKGSTEDGWIRELHTR